MLDLLRGGRFGPLGVLLQVAYLLGMDLPEAELFAESSDEVAGMEWPTRTPHTRTDA